MLKAKSMGELYVIIEQTRNFKELLDLLNIPQNRLLIYRHMHSNVIHHMQIMAKDVNIRESMYDCFNTITDMIFMPYFWKYSDINSIEVLKMKRQINYCFRELYRRQPFLALFRKQQNWWPYTFRGHAKRLFIVNECIIECLDLMLWERTLEQR